MLRNHKQRGKRSFSSRPTIAVSSNRSSTSVTLSSIEHMTHSRLFSGKAPQGSGSPGREMRTSSSSSSRRDKATSSPVVSRKSFNSLGVELPQESLPPQSAEDLGYTAPITKQSQLGKKRASDSGLRGVQSTDTTSRPTTAAGQVHSQAQMVVDDPVIMNKGKQMTLAQHMSHFDYGTLRHIRLPPIPDELQKTTLKRVSEIQPAKGFTSLRDRVRDQSIRKLQTGVELFFSRLDASVNTMPRCLTHLHPFEFEVAALTLAVHDENEPLIRPGIQPLPPGVVEQLEQRVIRHANSSAAASISSQSTTPQQQTTTPLIIDGFNPLRTKGAVYYSTVLANFSRCREKIVHYYFKNKKNIINAKSPEDIHKAVKIAEGEFAALLQSNDFITTIGLLRSMAYTLRRQHWIDPNIPTLVCVGAPNVGKSSIVRCVSSSKTKVQMYRFTTRKLTMGHADVDGFMCQITDSPGLLPRPDIERNAMEALTLAAIRHLPACGVLFVLDPSAQGGIPIDKQLLLRAELRWRYGPLIQDKWIDVSTKADLWSGAYGIKTNVKPPTSDQWEHHNNPLFRPDPKAKPVTPKWNLQDALTDLGQIPKGFTDMTLPYYSISTIHVPALHDDELNKQLDARFTRSLRAKRRQGKLDAMSQDTPSASNAIHTAHDNDDDDDDDDASPAVKLTKKQQQLVDQATHDIAALQAGMSQLLARLIESVEENQHAHQQRYVQELNQLDQSSRL